MKYYLKNKDHETLYHHAELHYVESERWVAAINSEYKDKQEIFDIYDSMYIVEYTDGKGE